VELRLLLKAIQLYRLLGRALAVETPPFLNFSSGQSRTIPGMLGLLVQVPKHKLL